MQFQLYLVTLDVVENAISSLATIKKSTIFTGVPMSYHFLRLAHSSLLSIAFALSSAIAPVAANPLTRNDGVFEHSPRLTSLSTTQPASFIPGGIYKLTITVPEDAGASLQAVKISQSKNAAQIVFAPDKSQVVADGVTVLTSAIGGEYSEDVTIVFERPIQPGSTVTISLPVERNAGRAGIYSFGVTAYSVGDPSQGLFLGYGHVTLLDQNG